MEKPAENPIAARIKARLDELGLSPRAASLKVVDNPDLIRNILRTPPDSASRTDTLAKAAQALEWTVTELLDPATDQASVEPSEFEPQFDRPIPALPGKANMLEIRGTAMGSLVQEGVEGFHFDSAPLGFVRRPTSLLTVREAYALIVTGDSMYPMHKPGETRIVNPRRPTAPGDTVIAITKHWDEDPGQAYIKLLLRRTQKSLFLKQLNPEATLEIPLQFLAGLHYVLTYDDLLGN